MLSRRAFPEKHLVDLIHVDQHRNVYLEKYSGFKSFVESKYSCQLETTVQQATV